MGDGKSFWSLTRRELFRLLPTGMLGWLPASRLGARPAEVAAGLSTPPKVGAKKWIAECIWESIWGVPPGAPPPANLFVYFRKVFDLDQGVDAASAQIMADSRYILYINGNFAGRGPARFDPTWPYYDEYNIARLLHPGRNAIAALVHYYGEPTGAYMLRRAGFLFECKLQRAGGAPWLVKSDATWKFLRAPMWTENVPRVSDALGFTELFDARKEVEGWNLPDYDDSRWRQAHAVARISGNDVPMIDPYPWDNSVPRDIPMLLEMEVAPARVTMVGEVLNLRPGAARTLAHQMSQETPGALKNCTVENAESLTSPTGGNAVIRTTPLDHPESSSAVLVLDFGREVTGRQRLELEGVAGGIIDMGVCESLANGRVTPTRNGLHFNRFVMRDGLQRWEAFEWDGFRYLQLTVRNCPQPVRLRKVAVNFTSYPVGDRGAFESNDSMLNKIWETCRYTLQLCMQDAYTGDANREQRQWIAYVEPKVNYSVFGDTQLIAKYLRQIAQSQRTDGIIQMFWPGDGMNEELSRLNIKDFVLLWIMSVWDYYQFTGDREMVRELFPNIAEALGWFENRIDFDGLLSNIPPWVFVDWAPVDRRDRNTVLNAWYYNALREAAQMAALAGGEAARRRYQSLALGVKAGMNRRLWDERRGVYVDANVEGVMSRRVSQQSNALCLLYDIATPENRPRIVSYIFDQARIKLPVEFEPVQASFDDETDVVGAQPYFMHWVNAALARCGEFERVVQLIRTLWGQMIDAGATTVWETWSRKASECHSWSATPAYDLMTYTLGVRGVTPGFGEFAVEPHPTGLEWVRGVFPSVKGDIPVSWHFTPSEFRIEGSLPPATTASVLIPAQNGRRARGAQLNGEAVWEKGEALSGARIKAEKNGVRIELRKQGRYEIVARY